MVLGVLAKLHEKEAEPREKPLVKLIRVSVQKADKLSILFTLCGIFGLLLLPLVDRHVKFDEKSLMVGGVIPGFRSSPQALPVGLQFAHAVRELQCSLQPNRTMAELIHQGMTAIGLEAFITPTSEPLPDTASSCLNVHGVLKAPQTDGSEALLLVTPVAVTTGDIQGRAADWDAPAAGAPLLLAAMSALLHHVKEVKWLSRDIVWVVPDARCGTTASLQHWANQYHGTGYWTGKPPTQGAAASGTLQQALILQADRADFTSAQVLVEGFDGQLPKLDTYLVLKELLYVFPDIDLVPLHQAPALKALHQMARSLQLGQEVQEHLDKLANMLSFMWRQTLGLPTGPHAALKTFMVDAATTRFSAHGPGGVRLPVPASPQPGATPAPLPQDFPARVLYMAEYAELVLRSFNNLDERFHHSFFLYLLTNDNRFVTVEMYIIPLVLLIGVLVLKAAKQRDVLRGGDQTGTGTRAGEPTTIQQGSSTGPAADQAIQGGVEGVQAAAKAPASQPDYFWPVSLLIACSSVVVILVTGLLARGWLCPACQLCSYKVGDPSCVPASGGVSGSQPSCSVQSGTPTSGSCTGTQGTSRLQQLSSSEHVALGLSALVMVGTLGWEACLLLSRARHASRSQEVSLVQQDVSEGVHVVLLCVAAVMLTGMASVNWALAYVVAFALSLVCVLGLEQGLRGTNRLTRMAKSWRGLALLLVSPISLLLLMGASELPSNAGAFWQDDSLAVCMARSGGAGLALAWCSLKASWTNRYAVLCCSWISTYAFTWATFVPLWAFRVWEWVAIVIR